MNNFLTELKNKISENTEINIICHYFSLNAFELLQEQIVKCKKIRILVNNDKNFSSEQKLDINNIFFENNIDNEHFEFNKYYYAKLLNELIENNKIDIKVSNNDEFDNSSTIIIKNNEEVITYTNFGNFFEKNLINKNVLALNKNINNETTEYFLKVFKDKWNSKTITNITKKYQLAIKNIYKILSCYECYNKSLSIIFKDTYENLKDIEINETTEFKNSLIYKTLYDFQRNAVYGIIDKLEKFNGCILADSVGLGKTYEALAVIKYYELKRQKVLVLTPKKLKENWTIFTQNSKLNPFLEQKFNYDVKNHTDINREKGYSGNDNLSNFNWSDFDLLVIDESHNFRNYSWTEDEGKNKSRYQNLMEKIIKSGRNTKVLLLSATPVNNRMQDLNNQIKFITNDNDEALKEYGINSISSVCKYAEAQSNKWSKLPFSERTSKRFSEMMGNKFKNLLNLISIARSRKQIISSYDNTNFNFPNRLPPKNIVWNIDESNSINIKNINSNLNNLTLASYKLLNYVYENFLEEYENLDYTDGAKKMLHIDREKGLVSLMKINLLKRLESSISSFNLTIKKIIFKSESLLNGIEMNNGLKFINDGNEFNDGDLDEIIKENNLAINIKHIDVPKLKSDLIYDINLLKSIYKTTQNVNSYNDWKLKSLINIIEDKIKNPFNKNNKKILIFTSYEDTALYLYDSLKNKYTLSVVTGTKNISNHPKLVNKNIDINDILTYFSPMSKKIENSGLDKSIEFDILIGSDCISEGQNLQDCDCIVNYDIHWNPVRIIQRFGRIDRLESKNEKIQLINMWPNMELDEYIKLESRVRNKMEKVVHASNADDHILNNNGLSDDENYRLQQLKQLKENIDEYEEMKNDLSFSSLTLNEYLIDLSRYNNSIQKDNIEYIFDRGFFSLVDGENKDKNSIIFLFKKTLKNDLGDMIEPYVFIMVNKKNNEFINMNKTLNEILQIYKKYAFRNNVINNNLINLFNINTNEFKNMDLIREYYSKALVFLNNKSNENEFEKIFKPNANISEEKNDFQLISFLMII